MVKRHSEMRQDTAWLPWDLDLGDGTVKEVINYPFRFSNNNYQCPDLQTSQSVLSELGLQAGTLKNNLGTYQLANASELDLQYAICLTNRFFCWRTHLSP